MTEKELRQIQWHMRVPVCRTWHGCIRHLELVPRADITLLCRFLNCGIENLQKRFWNETKIRRWKALPIRKRRGGT